MIRILVIEDNANIIIPGLRNLFRPERDGISIACSAAHPDEALLKTKMDDFDIILLDLWIEGYLPLDNVKKLSVGFPGKPVIIYTQDNSPVWRRKMMAAGVKGYLIKSASREELKKTFEKVSNGEVCISGSMNADEQHALGSVMDRPDTLLTPAQQRMLDMLTRGMKREEIAAALDLHPSAIDKSFSKLRSQFKCKSNYELIRFLYEHGAL